jgi:GAF domain-containing protein
MSAESFAFVNYSEQVRARIKRMTEPMRDMNEQSATRRGERDAEIGERASARRSESAATLRTVVDMVRRIMRADTASVASFSLADKIITWKATSGFQTTPDDLDEREVVTPLQGEFAERAAFLVEETKIIEVKSVAGELPVSEFPLHSAEGVRDLALVPLSARGEVLGVLVVGYRTPHRFTAAEKQLLENLAEMAALALDNARLLDRKSVV